MTGQPVYLDLTHLGLEYPAKRFPRIHRTCLSYGIDIARDPIPVSPAAHYMMGGVATDLRGRTSIPGLYAAGEVACTGVHGANRLASNSLLEGLVFGALAGQAAVEDRGDAAGGGKSGAFDTDAIRDAVRDAERTSWDPPRCEIVAAADSARTVDRVKDIAWSSAGLLRDRERLVLAREDLSRLGSSSPATPVTRAGVEARNVQIVAHLIAAAALLREESRGAHFRTDFPGRDDAGFRRTFLLGPGGEVRSRAPLTTEPPESRS